MHPFLADIQKLGLYLAGWLLISLLFIAFLSLSGGMLWYQAAIITLPLMMLYSFICLSSWYICRSFPIPKTHILQVLAVFTITAAISSSLWIALGNGWIWILEQLQIFEISQQLLDFQPKQLFGFGIVLYLLASAVYYLISMFEASREAERRELQSRLHAHEAELRALRAQIDPHFLFNSLNSISALIMQKPESARAMCMMLADFFRNSMKYGSRDVITLQEELSLVAEFLQIEQIRFGSRLRIEQAIDQSSMRHLVPPLLLQPLVENSVNHGIAHLIDGGTIRVTVVQRTKTLKITIENPCDPDKPSSKGNGIGLENVKQRLHTLYGNDASLDITKNELMFRVDIVLPAKDSM